MDSRWHRRLRVGALLILAVLAAWPDGHRPDDDDEGAVAVSAQRSQ